MAPRRRNDKYKHLSGTNIQVQEKNRKKYYYYRMPSGELHPLAHGDEKTSIEAALILNSQLRAAGDIVNTIMQAPPRITAKNPRLVDALTEFKTDWIAAQSWAESTKREALYKLEKYFSMWPNERTGDIETFNISQFLKTLSPASAKKHRILLDQFFRFCASSGYQTTRPMVEIEKIKQPKRKRARHTWEGHLAIFEASPRWLQIAINTALYTLQRRADLVKINVKTDIDLKARTIKVLQNKTANYDKPVFIEIGMGDELYNTVIASIKSDVPCPFLIHARQRQTTATRQAKAHPFAVSPDFLTRAYSKVRDSIGIYDHLPKEQRPSIHSLRALGIWLYTKAGYSDEYIMALSGHATAKMKAHYYEGHEKTAPVKVSAGLTLSGVDFKSVNWETDLSEPLKKLIDSDE